MVVVCSILWFYEVFCNYGGVYCREVDVLLCNSVWVCAEVCCVSSFVGSYLFIESGSVYC